MGESAALPPRTVLYRPDDPTQVIAAVDAHYLARNSRGGDKKEG